MGVPPHPAPPFPGRDLNKQLTFAQFIEYFYHVLDVPEIEGVSVLTGSQCLLRCVSNDCCFSTNVGAFPGSVSSTKRKIFVGDLLPTDMYNASTTFLADLLISRIILGFFIIFLVNIGCKI